MLVLIYKIDRRTTPRMTRTIDHMHAVWTTLIILRIINLPESIGTLIYHATPIL
jgi:hypothetical protein